MPIGDVPPSLQKAVLAAEDRKFYSHGGFSPTGILRAGVNNVKGGAQQGGSTITQQLAKNLYLTQERTLSRKVKELVISMKMENTLSKNQILEDYLNTIYFGRSAYGVEAASEQYFGKPVGQLSVAESAVLASILRSPGYYAPETHLDRLKARWDYVLDGMVKEGWLTKAERDQQVFPQLQPYKPSRSLAGPNGYLVEASRLQLADILQSKNIDPSAIEVGGLRVKTTFDPRLQAAAVDAVNKQRPTKKADGVRFGLTAIEPSTGYVKAMYGGADYQVQQFNDATQAHVQAGSTFKPFALAAALEQNVPLTSTWDGNSPRTFKDPGGGPPVKVVNDDHGYGTINLTTAMAHSVNTVYVDLGLKIGDDKVVDAARRAGVPANVKIDATPTVVLGTASPSSMDMASAYGTFAAGGQQVTPTMILEVRNNRGGLIYRAEPKQKQAFSSDVVADVDAALQAVVKQGTGTKAQAVGRPVAGKTGTTTNNLSAWFVGYVPQLSVAVDMFKPSADNKTLEPLYGTGGLSQVTGNSFPLSIWTSFMTTAVKGTPVVPFPKAANLGAPTELPSPDVTPSETPTDTASPSASASPTQTASSSPAVTASVTPVPVASKTPSPSGLPSASLPPASGAAQSPSG